jgi:hypothetical protein
VTVLAAIEPDQLKSAAIVAIVVLVVLAFLVMRFIQKLVLKLIMVVALVGAGLFVYTQRDSLDDCQKHVREVTVMTTEDRCTCDFFGYEVKVPGCVALVPDTSG